MVVKRLKNGLVSLRRARIRKTVTDNAKKRAVHLTVNFRNINFDFKPF